MAIPDYQSIMLPLLKLVSDGQEYKMRDVTDKLADHFNLTEEERQEPIPSGTQALFYNRVGWARTYLVKAGLLMTKAIWTSCRVAPHAGAWIETHRSPTLTPEKAQAPIE